jgi:hypothetical protein
MGCAGNSRHFSDVVLNHLPGPQLHLSLALVHLWQDSAYTTTVGAHLDAYEHRVSPCAWGPMQSQLVQLL